MQLDAFSEFFSELHDPRQSAKISYPLFDILFLTVCAVIGGGLVDQIQSRILAPQPAGRA